MCVYIHIKKGCNSAILSKSKITWHTEFFSTIFLLMHNETAKKIHHRSSPFEGKKYFILGVKRHLKVVPCILCSIQKQILFFKMWSKKKKSITLKFIVHYQDKSLFFMLENKFKKNFTKC